MTNKPSFKEFLTQVTERGVLPIWEEFSLDGDDPVIAYSKIRCAPFSFLFESVVGGDQWSQYTFLGTKPSQIWRLSRGVVEIWTPGTSWEPVQTTDPLQDLSNRLEQRRPISSYDLPKFWGGAVGYFGYDVVRMIEELPNQPEDDLNLPDGLFAFMDVVLAVDNMAGSAMAIASVEVDMELEEEELRYRYDAAVEKITELIDSIKSDTNSAVVNPGLEPSKDPEFSSTVEQSVFEENVLRIREYITAGDVFQVVLSQRFSMTITGAPFDLYSVLRNLNPSPYMYLLEMEDFSLVGSSPEVLVRLRDDKVTVRPIAGTRPRGENPKEDMDFELDLRRDAKELAEHRMLVDLGRNDIGRIAEYGSVKVTDLMVVEMYSHVMHLVSQVEGNLAEELCAMDVFKACFPAGTVSGAPKVRAMEIIDELEPLARGPYAGAVGYFGWGSLSMDLAITIRTVLVSEGKAFVQAGAGIVADSEPRREFDETVNKARALLRAVSMLENSAD
tara:strand:- start:5271 stop:6773 length:1503 start_codon:yes stop_codon:yes gene_type:complete